MSPWAARGRPQDTRASRGWLAHGAVHHLYNMQYRSRVNQHHHPMRQELPISLVPNSLGRCALAGRYRPFKVLAQSVKFVIIYNSGKYRNLPRSEPSSRGRREMASAQLMGAKEDEGYGPRYMCS